MKFERQPMVRWYNVRLLATTGLKTVVSSLFGNFADKREIQAALSENEPYDYSSQDEIWVDYIADLGDGFDATFSMAHLLAKPKLEVEGSPLQRGKLLIMGGDEVYPTPEVIEYKNRLQGPYNAAYPWNENDSDEERPHLYAIPGNHDWYDGLTNFIKLFCQERAIGNWVTRQKRSYFAIKLPHRCWLWGIDVQLHADIDRPQREYFTEIVNDEMEDGDTIILCTAEPAWIFDSINKSNDSYDNLKFFIEKHILLKDHKRKNCSHKHLKLLATFSGDLHHYSRYEILDGDGGQLITAGGGGAFMHPTHILKDHLITGDQHHARLKKTFPSRTESRSMAFKNLLFPFLNREMSLMLSFIYLFIVWFLQSMADTPITTQLAEVPYDFENTGAMLHIVNDALVLNPFGILLNLLLVVGILVFTDTAFGKGKWNWIIGVLHGIAHMINLYVLLWLFSRTNYLMLHGELFGDFYNQLISWKLASLFYTLLFVAEMMLVGGVSAGFIFGVYLLLSTLIFQSHPTESFSSFRETGFKNFLRLHISPTGVSIYPIGVRQVVTNWKNVGSKEKPSFKGKAVKYELIEPPIHIKFDRHETLIQPPEHIKTRL
ncbi:metallophosphoesterase [Porifericola rhodea]|uniref:metallophosphoesterase n=1 Tax=Porifericola rhodea TaxID=930972 RepID=UPI002666CE0F|nr:metallophosphoesterase [Porifericola rhodea]WKN29690.1 metallophosphoesterase [Porifericola rhodea]